jgi:hypothetical protein
VRNEVSARCRKINDIGSYHALSHIVATLEAVGPSLSLNDLIQRRTTSPQASRLDC